MFLFADDTKIYTYINNAKPDDCTIMQINCINGHRTGNQHLTLISVQCADMAEIKQSNPIIT